ncbi:4Fe-4S dicluster domain-containing protein [Ilyobacter sp.]|uniref:4Fe-4S dicluster domain-containing protein n=1 Tax=Ilyobacter sp. TaxID=3100343 RepID=UPI0035625312
MGKIGEKIRETAKRALENKEVDKILAWQKGDLWYDSYPAFISKVEDADSIIWDSFCVNNLSKYLIKELQQNDKVGIFVKGCDSTSFNQLLKDNRVDRERVVLYGIPCEGMIDPEKIKDLELNKGLKEVSRCGDTVTLVTKDGEKNISAENVEYDKCAVCLYPNPVVYDELMGEKVEREISIEDRFKGVEEIEAMSPDERYDFWAEQFKKCIRCNACRDICPACSCVKCVFDNDDADLAGKARVESEDAFFHMIRAYHVAGRCVDCGECARVCPSGIPLDKLNRKIIKDINENYGEFDAGADSTTAAPLVTFEVNDRDTFTKGGK